MPGSALRRNTHPVPGRRAGLRLLVALVGVIALSVSGAGALSESPPQAPDAVGDTDTAQGEPVHVQEPSEAEPATKEASAATRRAAEQGEPVGGNTASSKGGAVKAQVANQDVAQIAGTNAQANKNGSSSDSTVLSVGGQEVLGAHSESGGDSESSETGFLTETCTESDGAFCLVVLYGQASSSEDDESAMSDADAAVLSACLGGKQESPKEECDGPIGTTLLESHASAGESKVTGAAEADHSATGADICLGGEDLDTGVCQGFGIQLLTSSAHSEAGPGTSDGNEANAALLVIEAEGAEVFAFSEPAQFSLPPDCPEEGSAVCVFLNQSETSAEAGSYANAIGVTALSTDELDLLEVLLSESGTNATPGTEDVAETDTRVLGRRIEAGDGAMLARTGNHVPVALGAGLLLLVAGFLVYHTGSRRYGWE